MVARFGGEGARGLPGIDFKAFLEVSRARFRCDGSFAAGVNFEAFWRSLGQDLEVMGHWGLQDRF